MEGDASQWLSVLPLTADALDLSALQFQDALAIRYGKRIEGLPTHCDGCPNIQMNMTHALNCKKGGHVKLGHDLVRDECARLAGMAMTPTAVGIEPVLFEGAEETPRLVADIRVQGFWDRERAAYFDNRIVNADASSHYSQPWTSVLDNAAREKHRKYDRAVEDLRGSFTPLICTVDGVCHKEYGQFTRRLAYALSEKWQRPFSYVMGWVRTKLQFTLIRAVSLRLRGARQKVRYLGRWQEGLGLEDGACLPLLRE